ncbi:MAG TPA: 3-oxoacyl-[acyl-carrier-protein] synthase III C-terminal domain-containing protein [Blastocatellia bacterium]|jgi:3-oxoacyl-[acyl-carrier-protein] synthase III
MFDLSKHDIGIDRLDFYLPDNFYFLKDYCRLEPEEFTLEKMNSIWSASFFEADYQHRFFLDGVKDLKGNLAPLRPEEVEEFTRDSGIDRVYCASHETASDMALKVSERVLRREPDLTDEINVVIHYHSTLNERLGSSTPGRIQHEAQLKNTFGFSVDQKNDCGSIVSLKIAAEMLAAEPEMKAILLAGSEKLAAPYSRVFGKMTVMGDSASAMVVRRGAKQCRLLGINIIDCPEGWDPCGYTQEQLSGYKESMADRAAALLGETLESLRIRWNDVALLIPPNINLSLANMIGTKLNLRREKIYSRNIARYGYLMATDMVANLSTSLSEGVIKPGDIVVALNIAFGHSLGCAVVKV